MWGAPRKLNKRASSDDGSESEKEDDEDEEEEVGDVSAFVGPGDLPSDEEQDEARKGGVDEEEGEDAVEREEREAVERELVGGLEGMGV